MDEFMIDTEKLQEQTDYFRIKYSRLRENKAQNDSQIKEMRQEANEKIGDLQELLKGLNSQLKTLKKDMRKIENPWYLQNAENQETSIMTEIKQYEEKIVETRTKLKKDIEKSEKEITDIEAPLTARFKNFISDSLAEIKDKKDKLAVEAIDPALKKLEEEKAKLLKAKSEKEKTLGTIKDPKDSIGVFLSKQVKDLDTQIEELNKKMDSLKPDKLSEKWNRLDAIEKILTGMQTKKTAENNKGRKSIKANKKGNIQSQPSTQYDIIDGLKKVQEVLNEINPNKNSVMEAKKAEKAIRAKAMREAEEARKAAEAKRNEKAEYEEAKRNAKAKAERILNEAKAAKEARKAAMAVTGDLIDPVTPYGQLSDDKEEEPLEPERTEAKTERLEDTIIVGPDDIVVEDNAEHSNDEHGDNQNEEENSSDFIIIDPEDARVGNDAELLNYGYDKGQEAEAIKLEDLLNSPATPKKEAQRIASDFKKTNKKIDAQEVRKATAQKAFEEGKKREVEEAKRKAKEEKKTGFWTKIKKKLFIGFIAVTAFLFGRASNALPLAEPLDTKGGSNPAQETEDQETAQSIAKMEERIRIAELREDKIVDNHEVYQKIKEEAEKAKEAKNFKDELKVETNPIGKRIILPGNTVLAPTAYLEGKMGNSNNIAGGKSVTDTIITGVHAIDRKTGKRTEFDPSKSTYEDWLAEVEQSDMFLSYDLSRPNEEGKMTHIGYVSKDTYDMMRAMEQTSQRRKGNGMGR